MLDFWDLVTVAVLHSLFASGVRFKHLTLHERIFDAARVLIQKPLPKGAMDLIGGPGTPYPKAARPSFWRVAEWEQVGSLADRQVQTYLEERTCDVIVSVQFKRPMDFGDRDTISVGAGEGPPYPENIADIWFAPLKDRAYYLDNVGAISPFERHAFINCKYWGRFVENRLSDLV